jgi:hypothetical protein
VRWDWTSPVSIALFAGSLAVLLAFVLVERRAAEPVLPLWVFSHRVILPAILTALAVGVLLSVGGASLILALLEGGVRWDWTSPVSIGSPTQGPLQTSGLKRRPDLPAMTCSPMKPRTCWWH